MKTVAGKDQTKNGAPVIVETPAGSMLVPLCAQRVGGEGVGGGGGGRLGGVCGVGTLDCTRNSR